MNQFEKEYYETASFWEGDMVADEPNIERIRATIDLIPEDVTSLLDAGCGNGVFLNKIASNYHKDIDLMGVDRSYAALKHLRTNKVAGDISAIPFEDNSYDCVTCLEVIEHLPVAVYQQALKELARVSSKYVIVSVPYLETLEDYFTKCPSCRSLFNRNLHLRSYDDRSMASLFDHLGYKTVKVQKVWKYREFAGTSLYNSLFRSKSNMLKWQSPICPICGFKQEDIPSSQESVGGRSGILSRLMRIPKFFWPRVDRYNWIVGVYEKKNRI